MCGLMAHALELLSALVHLQTHGAESERERYTGTFVSFLFSFQLNEENKQKLVTKG